MRGYFFGNMYLKSIQQGLQAGHVEVEMFLKYRNVDTMPAIDLYNWAENHKTMILLDGGYAANLQELINMFSSPQNPFPWAYFNEEEASLNGALTSVGIILPEKIYEAAAALRRGNIGAEQIPVQEAWSPEDGVTWTYTKWEYELCLELNKYDLAS